MPWIAALVLAASLLAGCDNKARSPAPAADSKAGSQAAPAEAAGPEVSAGEALRRLAELTDKVCACPDRACAEATNAAFQQEHKNLARRMRAAPTPAEAEAMQAQAQRFSGCVQKLP